MNCLPEGAIRETSAEDLEQQKTRDAPRQARHHLETALDVDSQATAQVTAWAKKNPTERLADRPLRYKGHLSYKWSQHASHASDQWNGWHRSMPPYPILEERLQDTPSSGATRTPHPRVDEQQDGGPGILISACRAQARKQQQEEVEIDGHSKQAEVTFHWGMANWITYQISTETGATHTSRTDSCQITSPGGYHSRRAEETSGFRFYPGGCLKHSKKGVKDSWPKILQEGWTPISRCISPQLDESDEARVVDQLLLPAHFRTSQQDIWGGQKQQTEYYSDFIGQQMSLITATNAKNHRHSKHHWYPYPSWTNRSAELQWTINTKPIREEVNNSHLWLRYSLPRGNSSTIYWRQMHSRRTYALLRPCGITSRDPNRSFYITPTRRTLLTATRRYDNPTDR